MEISVRRAESADAAALARLRSVMLTAMQVQVGDREAAWLARAEQWFASELEGSDVAAFVAQTPDGELVASALGEVNRRAPSPWNPGGIKGHVSGVVTDPGYRRRGLARGCVERLLTWFRDETQVGEVELLATDSGAGLYESLGFGVGPHTAMTMTVRRP